MFRLNRCAFSLKMIFHRIDMFRILHNIDCALIRLSQRWIKTKNELELIQIQATDDLNQHQLTIRLLFYHYFRKLNQINEEIDLHSYLFISNVFFIDSISKCSFSFRSNNSSSFCIWNNQFISSMLNSKSNFYFYLQIKQNKWS